MNYFENSPIITAILLANTLMKAIV